MLIDAQDDYYVGKNILVTGGSGFVGSALIDRLTSLGSRVTAFYHTVDFQRPLFGQMTVGSPPLSYFIEKTVVGDLRNPSDLREAVSVSEPEIVFHLGAMTQVTEARGRWYDAAMINAIGTLNVLEAVHAVAPRCDVVVASTDKVYGKGKFGFPFREDAHLQPDHPYDASKAAGDMLARAFAEGHEGFCVQVTRFANIYGPGDTNWKRIIPYTIRQTMNQKVVDLRSDGKHIRQYLYIDDAVDAYLRLAFLMAMDQTFPFGQAWNFAPNVSHPVLEIVQFVQKIMSERGYELPEVRVMGVAMDEATFLEIDDQYTRTVLKWEPKVSLSGGIENTVDWMSDLFNREVLYG